jgi:hypothetical protein
MADTASAVVRENDDAQDAQDLLKKEVLLASTEMGPVESRVDVAVPAPVLWAAFARPDWWPRWNRCFFWVRSR